MKILSIQVKCLYNGRNYTKSKGNTGKSIQFKGNNKQISYIIVDLTTISRITREFNIFAGKIEYIQGKTYYFAGKIE